MKLLRSRRHEVATLLADGDVEGLMAAARFRDLGRDSDGRATDQGVEVREQAILALGELGADAGDAAVAAALRDPFDTVRCAAVRVLRARDQVEVLAAALGRLPAAGRSRKLASRALLERRSVRSARAAAKSLVRAPGNGPLSDADVALLLAMLEADDAPYPAEDVILGELLSALADQRTEVADRAEDALARLAPTSTAGVVDELASGPSPERAAAVLGRIRDPAAMPALVAALESPSSDVRIQATAALGAFRDPAAVEPLVSAAHDPDPDVRAEAAHALDGMGSAAVVVGMSALLGPMIEKALAAAMQRPALADGRTAAPSQTAPSTNGFTDSQEGTTDNGGSPE